MPNNPLGPRPGGSASSLDITAAAVVKASPGTLYRVSVITASSAAGAAYDSTSTSGNTAADQILDIPANTVAGTVYVLEWPCANGIVVAPGSSGVLAVSYA